MDDKLRDLDEYAYPKRRPWLVICVLLLVAALVVYRFVFHKPSPPKPAPEPPAPAKLVQTEREPARPAPVSPIPQRPIVPGRTSVVATATPPRAVPTLPAPSAPPAPPPPQVQALQPADAQRLLQEGDAKRAKDDLAGAREVYLKVFRGCASGPSRAAAEVRLGEVTIELLFSPRPMPGKVVYTVKQGDKVSKIARQFGTTAELIARGNGLASANVIGVGRELRILDNARFTLEISKKRNDLVVLLNGDFCKRYSVGTGSGEKTPVGSFVITLKEEKPTWHKRGAPPVPFGQPENILGTRWMAIGDAKDPAADVRGLGIHGTWDETSIGKNVSAGCIRMRNKDVEELYALLPVGVAVRIGE